MHRLIKLKEMTKTTHEVAATREQDSLIFNLKSASKLMLPLHKVNNTAKQTHSQGGAVTGRREFLRHRERGKLLFYLEKTDFRRHQQSFLIYKCVIY